MWELYENEDKCYIVLEIFGLMNKELCVFEEINLINYEFVFKFKLFLK